MNIAALLTRLALILAVPGFGWIGVRFMAFPHDMAANMGMQLVTDAAVSTIRSGFGGFHIGVALLAVLFALRQKTVLPGLMIAATMAGSAVIARTIGLYTDGPAPETLMVFRGEAAMLTILVAALIGERWRVVRASV